MKIYWKSRASTQPIVTINVYFAIIECQKFFCFKTSAGKY